MILIKGERGTGKTTELVKISSNTEQHILCANSKRANTINDIAKELGLDIPQPLVPEENTQGIKGGYILVDDIEDVLQVYTNARIDYATATYELEKVVNNKPADKHEKEQGGRNYMKTTEQKAKELAVENKMQGLTVNVDIDTEEATEKLDELEKQLERIVKLQEQIKLGQMKPEELSNQDKLVERLNQDKTMERLIDVIDNALTTLIYEIFEE